jgi:shikimate kinase
MPKSHILTKHYFLAGFMGAGKSCVMSHLSSIKNFDVALSLFELDHIVAASWNKNKKLGDLIRENGIDEFRKREKKELLQLLNAEVPTFTALGGGSLEAFPELLSDERACVIWLKTPFETCLKQVREDEKNNPGQRPLASLDDEELRELYEKRAQVFKKAQLTLDVAQFLQVQCQNDLEVLLDIRRPASF